MFTLEQDFAAGQLARMEDYDSRLAGAVQRALADWKADTAWYAPIVEKAADLYEDLTGYPAPATFQNTLGRILAKTNDPATTHGSTAERVAEWVSTFLVNSAEYAAGDSTGARQWITKHDDRVRDTHVAVDGTVVTGTNKFHVGGVQLRFPGEPVGDPSVWINCRCVVKSVKKGAMTAAGDTMLPEIDPADLPAEDPSEPQVDADTMVPFHGVATVVDKPTGDRRQLAKDGFAVRPLPLPLFFQRAQTEGHSGSTIVGQFTNMSLNDAGEVEYDGFFNYTPEAAEAIQGVAEGWLRGVSVDLDDIMVDYAQAGLDPELAEKMSPEELMDAMQSEVTVFKGWRVSGLTMVGIPAFHEAYIALGTRDDAMKKKIAPGADPDSDGDVDLPGEDSPQAPRAKKGDPAPASGDKDVQQDEKNSAPPKKAPADMPPPKDSKDTPSDAPPFPPKKKKPGMDGETEDFAPGTHDGPGWITQPIPTGRIRRYWTEGEGSAKIGWGVPGDFNRCRSHLSKYIANQDWLAGACANMHKEATGVWPGQEDGHHAIRNGLLASGMKMAEAFNLVASVGVRDLPDVALFADPGLSGPTPITIEGDRVFGHIATWGTCHIGYGNTCTEAPRSATNYSWFRLGAIETDQGLVPVGQITLGTGHAGLRDDAVSAAAHYDNTGTAVADIATGEDVYGIWFSGRIRPSATEDQRAQLLAAKLSGDWRDIRGNLELVAALAVNTPGFGIPRLGLAASAERQTALVAAGIVEEDTTEGAQPVLAPDYEELIRVGIKEALARRERAAYLRTKLEPVRETMRVKRAEKLAGLRVRLSKEG